MTQPSPSTVRQATILLLLTTLFWGLSFPLVKTWQLAATEPLGGKLPASFTLIALRMLPALAILSLAQPRLLLASTRREYAYGALLGCVFLAGFVPQLWALASTTSPALSAFITSLGCAWAPLLAWLLLGQRVGGTMLMGLIIAISGVTILSLKPVQAEDGTSNLSLGLGEVMTLVASFLFAVQLILLDRLGKHVRTQHLSGGFFGIAGILGLVFAVVWAARGPGVGAWLGAVGGLLGQWKILLTLAALVLLPTVLSFHWMNTYQPRVPATRAALIYLMEPPFAAALSIPWGYDELTASLLVGGGLVLAGNLLVEVRGIKESGV